MISNFWQISPSGPNSLWLHTTKWEIGLQQTGTCWHCKNANLHLQRFYVRHRQSEYLPVRPDLAKFSHFGNILHVFDIYWTLDFLFGKMLSLLWRIWYIIGVIFIVASGHILKNWKIIYPSGHTGTYVWPSDRQIFLEHLLIKTSMARTTTSVPIKTFPITTVHTTSFGHQCDQIGQFFKSSGRHLELCKNITFM